MIRQAIQFAIRFINLENVSKLFFQILSKYPQVATAQATAGSYAAKIDQMLPLISAMLPVAGITSVSVTEKIDIVKAAARITGLASEINTESEWDKAVAMVAARFNPFAATMEMNGDSADINREKMAESLAVVQSERGVSVKDLALSYIRIGSDS